ncbi:nuclear transport factor 2 family protein [Sphingobium sp. CR2-8]|uniref:nuclear transport factor 2 family protein n=1 Tax=Sphingobium sp. CR2-8 TaxID=1306534 RepID=UPI002DBF6DA8|nr:nuclear transport factor 2 family protein [Sphingobium sp. CR2-8]MEC3909098.1 nuclear transport factor 2 family protein [Sphingobium sp. CR2-8]
MLGCDDRFALQELVNRYPYHLDLWHIDAWADLFIPSGVLDERALGMEAYHGRDAIAAYGAQLQADVLNVVHLMINHVILDWSADRASGSVFALVEAKTRDHGHARYYIRYEDGYVRTEAGWRFDRRTILPLFPPQTIALS